MVDFCPNYPSGHTGSLDVEIREADSVWSTSPSSSIAYKPTELVEASARSGANLAFNLRPTPNDTAVTAIA